MYQYENYKEWLSTNDGMLIFLKIRDKVNELLKDSGAVRMQEVMDGMMSGSSFEMLACIDRLVEIGELREITGAGVMGQHRVFVRKRH